MIKPMPTPLGGSSPDTPGVLRDHHANRPAKQDTALPHRAIQAKTHRRVSSASAEKPIPKTNCRTTNTREVMVTRSAAASELNVITSMPVTDPVWGRTKDRIATSTATATTTARAPGSISPATLRSALRRSPLN